MRDELNPVAEASKKVDGEKRHPSGPDSTAFVWNGKTDSERAHEKTLKPNQGEDARQDPIWRWASLPPTSRANLATNYGNSFAAVNGNRCVKLEAGHRKSLPDVIHFCPVHDSRAERQRHKYIKINMWQERRIDKDQSCYRHSGRLVGFLFPVCGHFAQLTPLISRLTLTNGPW